MNKLASGLEHIFKFRIVSNDEIPTYMQRMAQMGKIDDVRRHELLVLILKTLAELEKGAEMGNMKPNIDILDVKPNEKLIEPTIKKTASSSKSKR